MSLADKEKAFTAYLADLLGLVVDSTILRGNASVVNVAGLFMESAGSDNNPRTEHYTAQILGHYTDRDFALGLLETINNSFPAYGQNESGYSFSVLKQSAGVYPDTHDNNDCTTISAHVHVEINEIETS